MSSTLGYSDFEPSDNTNNTNNIKNNNYDKPSSKNRTIKNRAPTNSARVQSMLKHIQYEGFSNNDNDDDDEKLASFPPKPNSAGSERISSRDPNLETNKALDEDKENDDKGINNIEGFNSESQQNYWDQDYYQQYIPMYTHANNINNSQDANSQLIEKLNYMIHLLEEEREVKQGSVTEEVVLYLFLGVFVIFVIDSFVKVGKYVR